MPLCRVQLGHTLCSPWRGSRLDEQCRASLCIREIHFENQSSRYQDSGISFELPRHLSVTDCANQSVFKSA